MEITHRHGRFSLTEELSAVAILIIRKLELLLQAKKPAVAKAIAILCHVLA